jgi:uncharacterized protein (TIGR04255 family)
LEVATRIITAEELEEVFPESPLREVDFEIRFSPRLRVPAEIWQLQDKLVSDYPEVGKESTLQPGGVVDVSVFQNRSDHRVIKVSHENFVIAFTRYVRFRDFKAEVLKQTELFCSTFGIDAFTRIGLRYVNEIMLPTPERSSLLAYLRPVIAFDHFPLDTIDQFVAELRARYQDHSVTLRSALLPDLLRTYILDIDCHSNRSISLRDYPALLDRFHDSAQRLFLDHVTEEYKQTMRGKK